ncbi:MAG: FAD-binding oxidoreductase [Leptonema sp. (in: bacteria)]
MNYKNQQRIWNGWGILTNPYWQSFENQKLQKELENFLNVYLPRKSLPISVSRNEILSKIDESKISIQDLEKYPKLKDIVNLEKEVRLDYSFGQSFPDWVRFRTGWDLKITDAVAFPKSIEDLQSIYDFCRIHDYRMILYGGGTSVVGHILPENDKPVITVSMEKLNQLKEINQKNSYAVFEAGISGPEIEEELQKYGYRLGHYPQSFELSTLGGWIATRSSGQQSLYYGKIEDLFLGGKLFTKSGILEIFPIPASSAGLDLKHLLLGSEGRLGVIFEATMKIRQLPEIEEFHGIFFKNSEKAIDFIRRILSIKMAISMIRLSFPEETKINLEMAKATGHRKWVEYLESFLKFKGFRDSFLMMIVGFTGTKKEVGFSKKLVFKMIKDFGGYTNSFFLSKRLGEGWKRNRFFSPYLRNILWDLGYGVDTLETCLPWENILMAKTKIEETIRSVVKRFGEEIIVYSHLSHVYLNGSSLYTTMVFPLKTHPEEIFLMWKEIKLSASNVITELKGTISHQHGVGKDHKPFLIKEKGVMGMQWMEFFIKNSDPEGIWNNKNLV